MLKPKQGKFRLTPAAAAAHVLVRILKREAAQRKRADQTMLSAQEPTPGA